jgi:hypothetical protein
MSNLTAFRTNLRLDLGDGATNYSNAEIDRSVQRAVRDLSRYMPREQMFRVLMALIPLWLTLG